MFLSTNKLKTQDTSGHNRTKKDGAFGVTSIKRPQIKDEVFLKQWHKKQRRSYLTKSASVAHAYRWYKVAQTFVNGGDVVFISTQLDVEPSVRHRLCYKLCNEQSQLLLSKLYTCKHAISINLFYNCAIIIYMQYCVLCNHCIRDNKTVLKCTSVYEQSCQNYWLIQISSNNKIVWPLTCTCVQYILLLYIYVMWQLLKNIVKYRKTAKQ